MTCSIAASACDELCETPRRQHQRIAAGEDHLPDLRLRANIVERRVELRAARAPRRPAHHLAAEAKTAIDRADMERLEQHPVGIAMHDALDRAVRASPIGSARFLGAACELGRIGNELARDRVGDRRDR